MTLQTRILHFFSRLNWKREMMPFNNLYLVSSSALRSLTFKVTPKSKKEKMQACLVLYMFSAMLKGKHFIGDIGIEKPLFENVLNTMFSEAHN